MPGCRLGSRLEGARGAQPEWSDSLLGAGSGMGWPGGREPPETESMVQDRAGQGRSRVLVRKYENASLGTDKSERAPIRRAPEAQPGGQAGGCAQVTQAHAALASRKRKAAAKLSSAPGAARRFPPAPSSPGQSSRLTPASLLRESPLPPPTRLTPARPTARRRRRPHAGCDVGARWAEPDALAA